jgi:molybdenum cofactor biosynthesis enzyme MoaA
MTEEEYDQKKKEIKYLRERVRRTKLANDRHAAGQAQKKLQEALDATTEKVSIDGVHSAAFCSNVNRVPLISVSSALLCYKPEYTVGSRKNGH